MAYTVEVKRSRRKTMSLEERRDGTVLVRAPMRTSEASIRAYLERGSVA